MVLSMSVDPEEYVQRAQVQESHAALHKARRHKNNGVMSHYTLAGRYGTKPIPKYHLPEKGLSERSTYHLLSNELLLDGKPGLNLE